MLLGKTGSGKTSAVETIVGRESFTNTCQIQEACVDGKNMKIIDTPGLIDVSEEKMTAELEKCVRMSAPGPHVFLLVIRLDERFKDEEKEIVKWVQNNIGIDAVHYSIILFTHADHLRGTSLDEYITESVYKTKSLVKSNGRYQAFNIEALRDPNQVKELLEKIENIAEENGWGYYTNEWSQKILKRKRWLTIAAGAAGTAGAAAVAARVAVIVVTDLVSPPSLIMTLGGLALAGGLAIYKTMKK